MGEYQEYEGALDATGMRLAIVAGRFNEHVTKPLLDGALSTLSELGVKDAPVHWVPGAFEIPLVAQRLASSGAFDAVVCLGAVIRGDTPHFVARRRRRNHDQAASIVTLVRNDHTGTQNAGHQQARSQSGEESGRHGKDPVKV